METTKLSSKGQVVLPKSIRLSHHWEAGLEFSIEDSEEGIFLRPLKPFKSSTWKDVIGCLPHRGKSKTLDDMENAIRKGIKDRYDRNRY